jgi:predicted O-methyltransferase YrrM
VYLDTLPLQQARVGYGQLGTHGSLGYESKFVQVRQQHYKRALSTHPPARLAFDLGGRFARFCSQVALNDDVAYSVTHADFMVLADGRQVAAATHVAAGQPPRELHADISGAQLLELVVKTRHWECSHAVWLDPQVDEPGPDAPDSSLLDCLGRAAITLLYPRPRAKRCIATLVSPGFEGLLDDMLGSLYANGGCQDALLVVFLLGTNASCEQVAAKYGATPVHCRPRAPVNANSKGLLYSLARVIDAEKFLCLDADMLVLGDLNPVFAAIEACPEGSLLACRENNNFSYKNLEHVLTHVYRGKAGDLQRLLGTTDGEATYPLTVNDGTFAGGRTALLALDSFIRSLPKAAAWTDERRDIWWRNQFIFNLALARLQCGVELDPAYNVQLNGQDVELSYQHGRVQAIWHDRSVRVMHFNGNGRYKYPEWRNLFARVSDPLVGTGGGDGYSPFLTALRAWVGRYGLSKLAWSFYGTSDARSARVPDIDTLPLFALLHYLVRSNGCARVLETGTARGVSAACLASAVAHRANARVVTFDPEPYAERLELWAALPETMSKCIELRSIGSLEGMAAALAAGERYDGALLDSLHTEEHVWAEFQLASQLVCQAGLILVHDVRTTHSSVEKALRRIEEAGYGVVRLWTAECGVHEDDQLGLAVIENHRRSVQEHMDIV